MVSKRDWEQTYKDTYPEPFLNEKPFYSTGKKRRIIDLTEPKFYAKTPLPQKVPEVTNVRLTRKEKATQNNRLYQKLKVLSEESGKKFILDENCQANQYQRDLKNVINASIFCAQRGHRHGVSDSVLLKLAMEDDYIIVTRDRGLVLRCFKHAYPVVWIYGLSISYIDSIPIDID